MKNYAMEFFGTLFLVFTIGLSGDPLTVGCVLMTMIYIGGHISGAHYNPAVTLAFWLRGRKTAVESGGYMIAQLLGAIAAAQLVHWFAGSYFTLTAAARFSKALTAEVLFTLVLCFVILTLATTKRMSGNNIYGLAIGLTVTGAAYVVGDVSGAALNPAVGIGPMLLDVLLNNGNWSNLPLYTIGPFVGGALSVVLFKYFNPED